MSLSDQIISQALSGSMRTDEGYIARRSRERERNLEKRNELLARPDLIEKRVAEAAQRFSSSTKKLNTRRYNSKFEAVSAQAEGTPQEGFASELYSEYTNALQNPEYSSVPDRQLLADVAYGLMRVPDENKKSRLDKIHKHKWAADTGLGNLFGIFGEDKSVRKLPGHEEWVEREKAKPRDEWHTSPVEAAVMGGGFTAALMAGSKMLGRAGFAVPHPVAKIAGAALMAIPEFMAIDAVRNVLHKTEWARSREGSWKAYVPAAIGIVGGSMAAGKAIKLGLKKAAEKSLFSKEVTELLKKNPTAANAIRAGEVQKAAKIEVLNVDKLMDKYVTRKEVLKSQYGLAESYLEGIKKNVVLRTDVASLKLPGTAGGVEIGGISRRRILKPFSSGGLEIGAVETKLYRTDPAKPLTRKLGSGSVGGIEVGGITRREKVQPFSAGGLEAIGIDSKFYKSDVAKGLGSAEIRAAELTGKRSRRNAAVLLDSFEEASGRIKPITRKKAAKIFTKELSDEGTELALKKAEKTGDLRGAVVEQQRVQSLAKKQKVSEKVKIDISAVKIEQGKKKKLQGELSKAITEVERKDFIKERVAILKKRKEGVGLTAEVKTKVKTTPEIVVEKEFLDTISLEEAGLIETGKKGIEETLEDFADNTSRDLIDLLKDSSKLFTAIATVTGTTALLGTEEAEASSLIKAGLKLVPKFKNTGEALLFGEKASAKQITELKRLSKIKSKESAVALERKEFDRAMEKATEEQFYNEALEVVEKVPQALKDLGETKSRLGTTALLGAEEAEASPLIRAGLKTVSKFKTKGDPFIFKDGVGKVHKVVAADYKEAFKKAGVNPGWDGIGEVATNPELSKVRFFSGIPQSSTVEEALLRVKKKMPKVWKTVKKVQVIPGDIWKDNKAGYFRQDTKTLTVIYDPKHVGIRGYINTIAHELGHAFEGRSGVTPVKEGTFAEGLGNKAMELFDKGKLGIAAIGSIPLLSLFSPDSAEAGMLSQVGARIPKVAAALLEKAKTKAKMLELTKKMKDANFLHIPVAKGVKEVKYVQSSISTAKIAVQKNDNLIKNIKAEKTPFGNWLTSKLSPYTTGNLLYDINPVPEIGNLQSVIGNNVMNHLTASANIFKDVPGLMKKGTAASVERAMKPLAQKYSAEVIAYSSVRTKLEKTDKELQRLYKALKKTGRDENLPAIKQIEAERASLLAAKEELKPIFTNFTKDWEKQVKVLAKTEPTTRIALACEDTADFVKYPWLKPLMKPEEKEAVIWVKNIFESYKGRMKEAGHDVIEGPFCHHAKHPEWFDKGAEKVLENYGLDSRTMPFTKFFHRAKYSKMMMPDINYTMQRYLIDAERRIQWSKFWGKGEKESWYTHRRWVQSFGTSQQKEFWQRISDAAIPPAQTKVNTVANMYSSFEVMRLLAFSPSVALKHYFKNIGTMSTMGVGNFASHLPEAVTTAIRGAKNAPEMKSIYKLLGIKSSKGKRTAFNEVADSFITQIHRMNMVADLDLEAMIPNKAGFWKGFGEKLQSINQWGSIPVRMIESVDRHHTILAAWEAGAKKGMTSQQAIYGIYSNILRLNFLSGACNPAWVRNPVTRSIFLFQNTAFKLMERRLVVAYRAGKDIKTALGVVRHQNIQKTLQEMAGIGKYMLGAEKQLKQNMIFDALTSTKGFFGTPVIKQAMVEAIISGTIISGGAAAGLDLTPQVWHVPFLKHGADAPTLTVNPLLNAMFRTKGEREKAEEYGMEKDFMLTAMAKNWVRGSGYLPQTANKLLRISKKDIPEIYADSKWSYFFSVPALGEH